MHDDVQPLIALREQIVEQLDQPLDAIAEVHHEHFEMRRHLRAVAEAFEQAGDRPVSYSGDVSVVGSSAAPVPAMTGKRRASDAFSASIV